MNTQPTIFFFPLKVYFVLIFSFRGGSAGKESACNEGNLGGFPGEGNGYPLQYSGLESSMDRISMGSQKVGHNGVTFTFTCIS